MKQNGKGSAHSQVVALFQPRMPCGECSKCLNLAVSRVFKSKNPTPGECRHLWAVLTACVRKRGWDATRREFDRAACSHFHNDNAFAVRDVVGTLMSRVRIEEAA